MAQKIVKVTVKSKDSVKECFFVFLDFRVVEPHRVRQIL